MNRPDPTQFINDSNQHSLGINGLGFHLRKRRNQKGSSAIELASIAMCMAVMAVFCADLAVIMMGLTLNDRACRDAARSAAQASNYNSSLSAAQAALKAHKMDGYYVTQPALDPTKFVYQDYSGTPPLDTSPYVTVSTSVTVRLPAPVFFFTASFKGNGGNGTMTFQQTYTYPIVKTQLYLP
jgi:Flp pilus assembly protein TadG